MIAGRVSLPLEGLPLSLVVCSKNRAGRLGACLRSIADLRTRHRWELILVDNGSTDCTASVMCDFIESFAGAARYVYEGRPGNGAGRNAGIRASTGRIVVFTDDDCYPLPDFLDQVYEVFREEDLGFMSGRILLHDPSDFPITYNESTAPRRFAAHRFVPCGVIQGANMAFRRDALIAAGGFDPEFGAGTRFAGEDWDLAGRIACMGWAGGYFPGPTVRHHHGRKTADAGRLIRFYDRGSGAVYAKLLMDPATRGTYLRGWARAALGDMKFHQGKILRQIGGAVEYVRWRRGRERVELAQEVAAGE